MVERLFLVVPRGCQRFVIMVFLDHTHLLFFEVKLVLREENEMRLSIILKIIIFHALKASCSTLSRSHQRLLKLFYEAAISLRLLEKSI